MIKQPRRWRIDCWSIWVGPKQKRPSVCHNFGGSASRSTQKTRTQPILGICTRFVTCVRTKNRNLAYSYCNIKVFTYDCEISLPFGSSSNLLDLDCSSRLHLVGPTSPTLPVRLLRDRPMTRTAQRNCPRCPSLLM